MATSNEVIILSYCKIDENKELIKVRHIKNVINTEEKDELDHIFIIDTI